MSDYPQELLGAVTAVQKAVNDYSTSLGYCGVPAPAFLTRPQALILVLLGSGVRLQKCDIGVLLCDLLVGFDPVKQGDRWDLISDLSKFRDHELLNRLLAMNNLPHGLWPDNSASG